MNNIDDRENHPDKWRKHFDALKTNPVKVFTQAFCFEFASYLHGQFGFSIRGLYDNPSPEDGEELYGKSKTLPKFKEWPSHVWCRTTNGLFVDAHGVNTETKIVETAHTNPKDYVCPKDVGIETVREKVAQRKHSPELESDIIKCAKEFFATDRFMKVNRP